MIKLKSKSSSEPTTETTKDANASTLQQQALDRINKWHTDALVVLGKAGHNPHFFLVKVDKLYQLGKYDEILSLPEPDFKV